MALSETALCNLTREEVLALTPEDKMHYFHALQVKHKKLEDIGKDLMRLLSPHNETNIIAVIGATGVGKTTLSKRLLRPLIEEHYSLLATDPSAVPFIFTAAPANGDRSISWATFYEKVMREVNEVLIEKKHANVIEDGHVSIRPRRHRTLAAMRDALESMLKHRRVQVLVVDEAFHLLRFGNYSAVMDTIKSLADATGIKILLIGSYDLFDLVTDYGQVARRAEILHFERYDTDNPADVKEFEKLVAKLQQYWPCEEVPAFSAIAKELLEASLGCAGLLKTLELQALTLQLENKGKWNPKFMAKAAKSCKLLDRIRKEIKAGEDKVLGATYGETLFSGVVLEGIIKKMSQGVCHV